jgi:hypothetical protein
MKDMIAGWVGKTVKVVERNGSFLMPNVVVVGTLLQVSDSGILIQCEKKSWGISYVPLATIHSIDLPEGK